MKLEGKKAIITGANRSIGKAIALLFAQHGADVVISYRSDKSGADDVVNQIEKIGRRARAIYADFSELENIDTFFNQSLKFLTDIDILVNCAGAYDTKPFLELDPKTYEYLIRVSSTTAMRLTQLSAKQMISRQTKGSIINISSISGMYAYPNRTAHSGAKAALNMLTKSSALELAKYNIRVNAIAPGSTPYKQDCTNGFASASDIPLKRTGTPLDQANAALFLACDESSWKTGQIMTIDGGMSLTC